MSRHAVPPDPTAQNLERVARLEREAEAGESRATRYIIHLTNTVGTPTCVVLHAVAFACWMLWNSAATPALRFDPYPFGLLTMAVSMEGVLVAILVLTTQNRMSAQSDKRDHLDLQVDLLAEQEMTAVLRLLARISEQLGIRLDQVETEETRTLMNATDIDKLIQALGRRTSGTPDDAS
jgi:uncharacterized membrane protein